VFEYAKSWEGRNCYAAVGSKPLSAAPDIQAAMKKLADPRAPRAKRSG
jgi:hypothetical protein